jgi:exodeoxyribonuclease VII large subunit
MEREPTYTVGRLAEMIGRAVDRAFPAEVWVQGEIRDLSRPPSGHVYFTLVDPDDDPTAAAPAVLPVTLFESDKVAINRMLLRSGAGRFADGISLRVRGRLGHYAARGTVQLRMLWIDTDYTLGRLAAERARVLRALADGALLDRNRGLPFPSVPLRIGLITSRGSAAHADFMEELAGSGIAFDVTVHDTRVQGIDAEASLVAAIEAAAGSEVIAVVRGGGSRTDLAAFDREAVARAVATSPVPVVVGIGHEVDETVVDRVAARSYRTPTACAAGLVDAVTAFLRRLDAHGRALAVGTRRRLARAGRDLDVAGAQAGRIADRRLRHAARQVHRAAGRVPVASTRAADRARRELAATAERMTARASHRLGTATGAIGFRVSRLGAASRLLAGAEARLETITATIEGRDPGRVLARGWTLTTDADGGIVRDPARLSPGDTMITVFAGGRVASTVDAHLPATDAPPRQEPR